MSAEARRDAAREALIEAAMPALADSGVLDLMPMYDEEARRLARAALDAFLSRPDDLVAVMGMEQTGWRKVKVRRRTQGGTE